jgi:signal transduction histidine kinase
MTLRTRVTLLTLLLLAASLVVLGFSVYGVMRTLLYRSLTGEVEDALVQAERVVQQEKFLNEPYLFRTLLPSTVYAQIAYQFAPSLEPESFAKNDISILERSVLMSDRTRLILNPKGYETLLRQGQVRGQARIIDERDGTVLADELPARASFFTVTYRPANSDPLDLNMILTVAKSPATIDATLGEFARIYAAVSLLVLMLSGLLANGLVRRTLRPLEWVTQKAEQITVKPDRLPELEGKNEVASLVRSLNQMFGRLESAWETQTRFLADASHELRTPVTAILGHVSYLIRRTSLSDQQKESLEIVQREGERMKKLVGDLLDLSQSGRWKMEFGPVHLSSLMHELCEEYGQSFQLRNGRGGFEMEVAPELWVTGDTDRLHQVFANIISNAQKAKASHIKLIARAVPERVVVRIEDNGEGIPKESLPHLFERFYRVDPSRDRNRGGSGLGLAIVRSIIEAHGGTIWVDSEVGKGSTFSVSLKRAAEPPPPP